MPTPFLTVVHLTCAKQLSKLEMPHSKQSVPWRFFFLFLFFPRSNINLPFSHLKPMISCFIPSDHRENGILSLPTETW